MNSPVPAPRQHRARNRPAGIPPSARRPFRTHSAPGLRTAACAHTAQAWPPSGRGEGDYAPRFAVPLLCRRQQRGLLPVGHVRAAAQLHAAEHASGPSATEKRPSQHGCQRCSRCRNRRGSAAGNHRPADTVKPAMTILTGIMHYIRKPDGSLCSQPA